jgi:amino acid adenylation domain-containing protein
MEELQEGRTAAVSQLPLERVDRSGELPLSFAQQRLWFLDQLEPNSPFYIIPLAVRVTGPLDVDALQRSLDEIVARHESLRTTFATVDGRPVQRIADKVAVPLKVVDLSEMGEAERDGEIKTRVLAEAQRPFDLSKGPVLRVCLLRAGDREHVVVLTMHHIASDLWSMGVFVQELAALYQAFSTGRPSPLPALPIQYADYAVWQREWLSDEVVEQQLDHWQTQLRDAPALLELPTDRPRPAVQSPRGRRCRFELSAELTQSLNQLARRNDATLFMTLLGALQTLLSRYSGQEQVCVGTPIAGRNRSELEGMIGFFVNTLVMRGNLSGDPSFEEFLGRVRETTLEAYAHQDLPFERLVDHLQLERDLSRTPLFQVMFAFQNAEFAPVEAADLSFSALDAQTGTAKFDLTFEMSENEGRLKGSVEYNTDLFDGSTIQRMLEHFQNLLRSIVEDPRRRVSDYSLLADAERSQLLEQWNATSTDYPRDTCVHELFEEQVRRTPDAVAVEFGEDRLTYRDLNRRGNQLAHHLISLGVRPDQLVGICVERSLEMIVGVLGILKAGAAYLPLDPEYPVDRFKYMLEDAGTTVVVTLERFKDRLPETETPAVLLDGDAELLATQETQDPGSPCTADNLVYVMYTSGSTGKPKGTAIRHRSVVRLLFGVDYVELDDQQTILQLAPLAFDASTFEIWGALLHGGRLVVAPPGPLDFAQLERVVSSRHVTTMWLTASLFNRVIETRPEALVGVKQLLTGGEALSVHHVRMALDRLGTETKLINGYGPTESTTFTCCYGVPRDLSPDATSVPIGRPIGNTRVYVLDPHLQLVPVGVLGELYVGGDGLATGYWKRPELTAEQFIENPLSSTPGDRLYRTGDVVRWLPTGDLEFLGRRDDQIKLRGYRIELAEIEAALREHASIADVVVVLRGATSAEKRLVAYIVPQEEQAPTTSDLRAHLQKSIPDYMVPSAFVALDRLPLNPNGKVDRKALPEPRDERPEMEKEYVPPRSATEAALVWIWCETLGVQRVGVHDNFFELGGHSLLATQLISRVRATFQLEVPLREVFQQPTVAGLAAAIERARDKDTPDAGPSLKPVQRTADLPLSFAQQRLWFLDQLEPNSPFYNMPAAVRVTGPLNVEALRASLNEIVRRHEALRTTFATADGRGVQRIAEALRVPFEVVDLVELEEAEREKEIQERASAEAQRPFNLSEGPLLRVCLLRVSDSEHVFLLTMHHIVSDGWSMGIFVRELATLYEAFSARRPSPLGALPVQYADYAVWQRERLSGEVLEEHLDYWKKQLGDAPAALEISTDRPRPAVWTFRGAVCPFELSAELTRALHGLARRHDATLFMTLLGAFQTLLSRYSGQNQVCVGTPIAGRTRPEIEGLIGFFVNTLVMQADLSDNPRFEQLLVRVRETALGAYAHQDLPFEQLVDHLQPERDSSRTPLFQVMFALQNAPVAKVEAAGLSFSALDAQTGTAKFDLSLSMNETPGGLRGSLEYNTDLFDRSTVERMVGHFRRLLGSIVADPARRASELSLLHDEERRQVLVEWNATDKPHPREVCIHEFVADQAADHPDTAAVLFGDTRLTYRELDERSNQLSHYLRSLGVGPDVLVGVYMERSLELVVGLLGVLKAGGAYVPVDPHLPPQRVQFMLEDTEAPVLLVQDRLLETLPEYSGHVVRVDADRETIAQRSTEALEKVTGLEHLAYVIYTSGSTGRPKGVMIPHQAICNHMLWMLERFPLTESDRVLQKTPISFDASVWEFWAPLMSGSQLIMAAPDAHQDPQSLIDSVIAQQVTTLQVVPTMLRALLDRKEFARCTSLRRVFCGGEPLPAELCRRFYDQLDARLYNLYGPTETAIDVTYWECGPDEEGPTVAIGRPVDNTQVYILDERLQPTPIGVPGELHLGGRQLARGYLKRPELTAEKFVADPFRDAPTRRVIWPATGTTVGLSSWVGSTAR